MRLPDTKYPVRPTALIFPGKFAFLCPVIYHTPEQLLEAIEAVKNSRMLTRHLKSEYRTVIKTMRLMK